MAVYRQVHISYWQDTFVLDLTPEEKYFYIYLMTNSKTSQCGVYELPKRIIEVETGYNRETVEKLLKRFVDYGKILYSDDTSEIFLLNWLKHNPINNRNVEKCVMKELKAIKSVEFKGILGNLIDDFEGTTKGLVRGYQGATIPLPSNKEKEKEEEKKEEEEEDPTPPLKKDKKLYGEYVSLTDTEYNNLCYKYGKKVIANTIENLNLYIKAHGYYKKYKDYNATIQSWLRKDGVKPIHGDTANADDETRRFEEAFCYQPDPDEDV